MTERISELMDGELGDQAAGEVIQTLGRSRESLDTWRVYHLISDAIRENQPLPQPAIVRPAQPRRWIALPIAASLAAVGLVGWLAFAPQQQPQAPVARASAPAVLPQASTVVPLPMGTGDYLLAHQGVSPRGSLQGMAPYVRSVSAAAQGARR
ncbi:MAG: sigma-E factor negative regulatory protein [Betaproteobacteria bacterium]